MVLLILSALPAPTHYGGNGEADLKIGLARSSSESNELATPIPGTAAITAPPVIVQGGAVTTASGLAFIAAATDNPIRAIDIRTGETSGATFCPAAARPTR
ncbi:hypothetical protein [Paracoccus halophilus]|uniref:hypothetical protein n=1 Tax=Paracoccus halophilus TaxID=376733 RepID=UPI00056B83E5